jgi:UDP-glucose 4-epimerase
VTGSAHAPEDRRAFVTGGAGFIGSHLVDRLLLEGWRVTVYDNFSSGRREFLDAALRLPAFRLVEGDVADADRLRGAIAGHDVVFHLAANADVRRGTEHPRRDLEQNTLATFGVLEAMRAGGARRILFTSTGSVYGEPAVFPTREDCPFPAQTSLYGASKLAGEALIAAYCTGFGFRGTVLRLVSILGERYGHGHVLDFVEKLRADPRRIEVLGDGNQRKSYLYVRDCVDALWIALERAPGPFDVFNVGAEEFCTVDESLGWICDRLGARPERTYTGGPRGWVGDSPFIFLDASRLRALGWRPSLTIREAVLRTVDDLEASARRRERG